MSTVGFGDWIIYLTRSNCSQAFPKVVTAVTVEKVWKRAQTNVPLQYKSSKMFF